MPKVISRNKTARGNSAQFFVAGELCRRGHSAVVTLGNTPNTDILCSNEEGTRFVHIQVKTYVPGNRTVTVGLKAEKDFGENFIWVLAGIPAADSDKPFEYYVVPSGLVAENVAESHRLWLADAERLQKSRKDNPVRVISIPPAKTYNGWSIEPFKNRWDLIDDLLQ